MVATYSLAVRCPSTQYHCQTARRSRPRATTAVRTLNDGSSMVAVGSCATWTQALLVVRTSWLAEVIALAFGDASRNKARKSPTDAPSFVRVSFSSAVAPETSGRQSETAFSALVQPPYPGNGASVGEATGTLPAACCDSSTGQTAVRASTLASEIQIARRLTACPELLAAGRTRTGAGRSSSRHFAPIQNNSAMTTPKTTQP